MNGKLRLIDVGARGGVHPRWKPFRELIDVVAFEPDPQECEALNSSASPYSIRFLPAALGAEDGEQAVLHLCRHPGCSSLLRPNPEMCNMFAYGKELEVVGTSSVSLNRMDTVCADFPPDVLKVDTQGTELEVLRGAGALLDNVLAVELEVEFVEQYDGQPLFTDVDCFMREAGFQLRGIRRSYLRNRAKPGHAYGGQLFHGDALYLRLDHIDCAKGHLILAAYRQYDLLASLGATRLIPSRPLPIRVASAMFSWCPNRKLRSIVDGLRPPNATDWHDPDFF